MPQPFTIGGEEIPDGMVSVWGIGSLGRALMFYGQACTLGDNKAIAAVASYYSVLHLSLFVCIMTVDRLSDKLRQRMNDALQSKGDPARGLRHREVEEALESLVQDHGMPKLLLETFRKGKKLREFLNYGPRVTFNPGAGPVHFGTCEYSPGDIEAIINVLRDSFIAVMQWLVTVKAPIWWSLGRVGDLVRPTGYYAPLVPHAALLHADQLRLCKVIT